MTTASAAPTDPAPESEAPHARRRFLIEVWIVLLLGVVSVATAYTTFQSSLYAGKQSEAYSTGQNGQTAAEALYLEGNQQYIQDAQTLARLAELEIASESTDAAAATVAEKSYETLYFMNVSEHLDTAIERANEANTANADFYTSPLDDDDYLQELFGGYQTTAEESQAATAQGDVYGGYGDRLTLNATLMAITLFLLGVAAVVRRERTKLVLTAVGAAIFLGAGVLTAIVPFTWL